MVNVNVCARIQGEDGNVSAYTRRRKSMAEPIGMSKSFAAQQLAVGVGLTQT